jgi:hypothetical protein
MRDDNVPYSWVEKTLKRASFNYCDVGILPAIPNR